MRWSLNPQVIDELPKLFWIADLDLNLRVVKILHGPRVEVGLDYVVEGIWDGPFAEADFDRSQHFFGSGLRIRGDATWLVPSRALVDRVLFGFSSRRAIASNSLPGLLAYSGAKLDPAHDYRAESYALLKGVVDYDPSFRLLHPSDLRWQQSFYTPVEIGSGLPQKADLGSPVRFQSFEEYDRDIRTVLASLCENARDPGRTWEVRIASTISRGYDSPAVNALAKGCGIEKAYTVARSNSIIPAWLSREAANDDGTAIASRLGIHVEALQHPKKEVDPDEVFYLAPSTAEPELAFHSLMRDAEQTAQVTLLFTAYNGGSVWFRTPKPHLISDVVSRGDTSGFNLSEIRLKAGVINVAAPFIFGRSSPDLVAISNSEALGHWRIGGAYDKPIARRIVEEAGIPRAWFGQRKRAVVQQYALPYHPGLRKDFLAFLRERYGLSAVGVTWRCMLDRFVFLVHRALERALALVGIKITAPPASPLLRGKYDLSYFLHIWAVERLTDRYDSILNATEE